jgi:hypothetical protein
MERHEILEANPPDLPTWVHRNLPRPPPPAHWIARCRPRAPPMDKSIRSEGSELDAKVGSQFQAI